MNPTLWPLQTQPLINRSPRVEGYSKDKGTGATLTMVGIGPTSRAQPSPILKPFNPLHVIKSGNDELSAKKQDD